jgi:hypothetical protein
MAGYTDKEIADREQVMDALESNQEELKELMKLRGMTEAQPGYQSFALNFAKNKLRDAAMQNEFIKASA